MGISCNSNPSAAAAWPCVRCERLSNLQSGYRTGFTRGQMLDRGRPERVHTNHCGRACSLVESRCVRSLTVLPALSNPHSVRPANVQYIVTLIAASSGVTAQCCDPERTSWCALVNLCRYALMCRLLGVLVTLRENRNYQLHLACLSLLRGKISNYTLRGFREILHQGLY